MVRVWFSRFAVVVAVVLVASAASAQVAGPNINMVSGTQWPGGDPFLQRQDEPSIAFSTRGLHLLAGANDYRTVDLPGLPDDQETGDAWLGVFQSRGVTWTSTLLPGYPQDQSLAGTTSPIKGFPAAADPMVRSGLQGMFYYSGIALKRPLTPADPTISAVFVARFNDRNDRETGDPISYIDNHIVYDGRVAPAGQQFADKPSLAVDLPRFGSSICNVAGQSILAGNVYVAYTILTGSAANQTAKLWFSRSTNCGQSWSAPIALSGTNTINQGSVIAVDTWTGTVYVAWRRFKHLAESDAIMIAKSGDGGKTFSAPVLVRSFTPFEQGTTTISFRTNAYPTMVTDASGRVYVAWSERTGPAGELPDPLKGEARVMLSTSANGTNWSAPVMVAPNIGRGHQFMPAITFSSSKLMLVFYDMREDSTIGRYTPPAVPGGLYIETRTPLGDLASSPTHPERVFTNFIAEAAPDPMTGLFTGQIQRRHTLDLRAAQASPGALPVFAPSQRVSQYKFGSTTATPIDPSTNEPYIEQEQLNPGNFQLFMGGTSPFMGDYVDVAPQYPFIGSLFNNLPLPAPTFVTAWTDNRDVRPPIPPFTWKDYTPVGINGASKFDPTRQVPTCIAGLTGMRNQNIYMARVTAGLFFGSPTNDKPLGKIQRAFVVTVQNTRTTPQSYRLQIVNQPLGGKATFQQIPQNAPALTTLDVSVNAKSSTSRSVFVTSTFKNAPVAVVISEITSVGGPVTPNGLTSATLLNPDPSSPDIGNNDPGTPDIGNTEVYTPDIGNGGVGTPDIGNTSITTPDIGNTDPGSPDIPTPDIGNTDPGTPDIGNVGTANPDIGNAGIDTPDIGNGSVTDTTWPVSDTGNTTASYSVKLLQTADVPAGLKLQLILHQTYRTPIARDCVLGTERHEILISNVPSPTLSNADNVANPDIGNASVPTLAIAPDEQAKITVRVVDPFHKNVVIPASNFLTPVVVAHAVNTVDLGKPNPQPPISLVITTSSLADGIVGSPYTATVKAIGGTAPLSFDLVPLDGPSFTGFPDGLTLHPSGAIDGSPTRAATYSFIVRVTDAATPKPHVATRRFTLRVTGDLVITAIQPSTAAAGIGQMIAVDVAQVPTLDGLRAMFVDATHTAQGFIFQGPSTTSRLFIRLPYVGDNQTQVPLALGTVSLHLENGNVTGAPAPLTVSTTPGTPIIRFVLPTQPSTQGCAFVSSSTPITEINPGVPIGVSAFGVDTTGAVLRYTQNNQFVDVFSQCSSSSGVIGLVPIFDVPQFGNGDITIQLRTSVNEHDSDWSAPVHLTVINP